MVLRCETYSEALKWAHLECKSYNVPEPTLELPDDAQTNDITGLFALSGAITLMTALALRSIVGSQSQHRRTILVHCFSQGLLKLVLRD